MPAMASSRVARDRPREIASRFAGPAWRTSSKDLAFCLGGGARDRRGRGGSRFAGPAWRKSSKYLAFALGEVSLTKVNLPRAMLLARRARRSGVPKACRTYQR